MISFFCILIISNLIFSTLSSISHSCSNTPLSNGFQFIKSLFSDFSDEIQNRRYNLDQKKEEISVQVIKSIENFKKDQLLAQKDLESYVEKFSQLYAKNLIALDRQKLALDKMKKFVEIKRPPQIDDSLEQFRRFYNESILVGPYEIVSKQWTWKWNIFEKTEKKSTAQLQIDKNNITNKKYNNVVTTDNVDMITTEYNIDKQMDQLRKKFETQVKQLSQDFQKEWSSTFKGDFEEDKRRTKKINTTEDFIGSQWIENKILLLDIALRTMQDKIQKTEKEFEELIFKRKANLQYSSLNDRTLNQILNLIDPMTKGWNLIKSEDGYTVYRKFLGMGPSAQYACVMCMGIIHASPKDVLELFEDNSRISEYNSFCQDVKDVEYIADDTKVVWIGSPPIFPFKPRDFCTIVHIRKLKDGTIIVLNRAVEHEKAPVTSKYQRAAIVLAANIIQPIAGDSKKCKLTMIAQVDPGGFSPPVLINHICTLGPIGFLKGIEAAARKKKRKLKVEKTK